MRVLKLVPGWPYLVSRTGSVYSLLSGRKLRPQVHPEGYRYVTLCRPRRQVGVHVAMLEAFVGPRPRRLPNLEWVTQSENVKHAYRLGLRTIDQAHRDRCSLLKRKA